MGEVVFYILPYSEIGQSTKGSERKFESDLSVNVGEFSEELKKLWPKSEVDMSNNNGSQEVQWQIPEPSFDACRGALFRNSIVEISSHPFEIVVEFVLWYRHYVPFKYRLFMMVPEGNSVIELVENTNSQDIRRAFWMENF